MSKLSQQPNFMVLYSDGQVTAEDIDDFIDRWHSDPPQAEGRVMPVSEFLGMTRDEYAAWVDDASALLDIVRARLTRVS